MVFLIQIGRKTLIHFTSMNKKSLKVLILGFGIGIIGISFIFFFKSNDQIISYQSGKNIGINALLYSILELFGKNTIGIVFILTGIVIIFKKLFSRKI